MDRQDIERIARQVMAAQGCHTVILYGSRARGDAMPGSDVDLVCIRDTGAPTRDVRIVEGAYIDTFIGPYERDAR